MLQALASAVATTVVLTLILRGTAQRRGWWLPAVVAGADLLLLPLYPWASTLSYGQVNVLLVALVAVDLLAAVPRRHALAGVCIGLATAVKLTPALFVLYLLLIRERRAALTAAATAAFVTLASAALDPPASVDFWTSKVFEIQRIGEPSWVDNQSLNGALHRLLPHAATPLWAVAVVVVVSVWLWRLRRNEVTADPIAGFALTAVVACLISPVTWIYHLVWLIPAGAVLVDRMTAPTTPARRRIIALAAALGVYGLLGVQIAFSSVHGAAGLVLGNLLVLLCLALLAGLPLGRPEPVSARRQHPIARGSGRTEALRPSL